MADESKLEEFRRCRERTNERILEAGNLEAGRFSALDTRTPEPGALHAVNARRTPALDAGRAG